MRSVIDQVVELLRKGKTVKGSIELEDVLVLWDLDFDGGCLKFRVRGHVDLDEQISLAEPSSDLGRPKHSPRASGGP